MYNADSSNFKTFLSLRGRWSDLWTRRRLLHRLTRRSRLRCLQKLLQVIMRLNGMQGVALQRNFAVLHNIASNCAFAELH